MAYAAPSNAINTLDFTGNTLIVSGLTNTGTTTNTGAIINTAQETAKNFVSSGITATGLTAGTTQTQAGATLITNLVCEVSTVANSGDGMVLPVMTAGQIAYIFNAGANPMKLYGSATGSATINAITTTTGITVTNGKGVVIVAVTATDLRSVTGA